MRIGRTQTKLSRRFVACGERYLALPGVLFMLTGVLLVGLSGWWSHKDRVEQHSAEVGARVESASSWLAVAARLHGEKEPTAFHRLVLDTTRDPWVGRVRVSIGGKVVASSRLDEINQSREALDNIGLDVRELFSAVEYGTGAERVLVEVWGETDQSMKMSSAMMPVLWIVGLGLLIMLGVYRVSRRQFGAISAVAGALDSYLSGERSAEALRIDPELGDAAVAWNGVLEAQESMRVEQLSKRAHAVDECGSSARLVSLAVGALPVGVVIYGAGKQLRYANNAAENMLGSMNRETGSESGEGFSNSKVLQAIESAARGENRTRWSTEIETGDSQDSVFRVTVRPLSDAGESVALVFIEDVTKQRLAEQARASFLARATHELRTPLTNIRLYAEQATEESETNPAERNRAINVINQESRRLERLVGDMLSSAEIENGSLEIRVDDLRLEAFFKELEHDYRAQAEQAGIALRFKLPPKLPVIMADREKLALAMHNLIGNALKYNSRGGWVEVGFMVDADGASVFSVHDNGFGISEEDQKRLFDPYFRSADNRIQHITGSGIGLGLARDVAKLHGGDIKLESAIDAGSMFTLMLPGVSMTKAA